MSPIELLFAAIKSQFPWAEGSLPCLEEISEEAIASAYAIAQNQDAGHLFASALENFTSGEMKKEFTKHKMLAVFRREQITYEENRIFALFDEVGIDYIPLKGSVIKGYYPEDWMRTGSDTDILIHFGDGERAVSLLKSRLGYDYHGKSMRDFQLFSKSGVHIELHHSPENGNENTDRVLSRIWDYAFKLRPDSHEHRLTPEFLVFYTVSHALYHFLAGGCGIKPFLDIWVMRHTLKLDERIFKQLLEQSRSERFYEEFSKLLEVWFGNCAHTELTEKMESFILDGGVYGNRENLGKAMVYREGGRLKYLSNRIFKPKKVLELQYPNLEKRPYLLPFYQIRRWFNLFDRSRRTDVASELSGSLKKDETAWLFTQLGI